MKSLLALLALAAALAVGGCNSTTTSSGPTFAPLPTSSDTTPVGSPSDAPTDSPAAS